VPYRDNFFGLMRLWHNSRAHKPLWARLDIIMVIATEPNMLIQDINQSPFNVGQTIELEDFGADQLAELNMYYGSPLHTSDIPAIHALFGGHPYLTSRALHTMLGKHLTWQELIQIAVSEKGPFADHLYRYLWTLREQPELRGALKQIINQERC